MRRVVMRLQLLSLFAISLVVSAQAAVPEYDVDARCAAAATQDGAMSPAQFKACLQLEQTAYDSVREHWDKLSSASQDYCLQQTSTLGMYLVLKGCVDAEYGASQSGEVTFKR